MILIVVSSRYVRERLAGAKGEKGVKVLASDLAGLKGLLAVEMQRSVHGDYASFLKTAQANVKLESHALELRARLDDGAAALDAIRQAFEDAAKEEDLTAGRVFFSLLQLVFLFYKHSDVPG